MAEAIEAFEPGSIERRRHKRMEVPLKVYFREVSAQGLKDAASGDAAPLRTEGPKAASAGATPFQTQNVSPAGLMLAGELEMLGDRPLLPGTCLELELEIGHVLPVRGICQVIWSKVPKDKNEKFTAGLKFLAMEKPDMERLEGYLKAQDAEK